MEIIDELEPTARSVYTGAIGYLGFDGSMDLNIAIRTIVVKTGDGVRVRRRRHRGGIRPAGGIRGDDRQGAGDALGDRTRGIESERLIDGFRALVARETGDAIP